MNQNKIRRQVTGTFITLSLSLLASSCGAPKSSHVAAATTDIQGLPEGTWAKQMILASDSSAAGIKSSSKIERLLLVKAKKKGDQFDTTEELCDMSSSGSKSTKLTFPEAFKRSLPQTSLLYRLSYEAGKVRLTSAPSIEVIGAKLNDPNKDDLPSTASDPRVFDQDGDKQPGATVEISASALFVSISGKVYLTQRTVLEESGVALNSEQIDGAIKWDIQQQVLGSDSTVLGAVSPKITPDLEHSRFSMRKLAEDATCQTLLAERDRFFQRTEN